MFDFMSGSWTKITMAHKKAQLESWIPFKFKSDQEMWKWKYLEAEKAVNEQNVIQKERFSRSKGSKSFQTEFASFFASLFGV